MRTNELHASAKVIQRSSGRSSVAAAAYRSASRLYDQRTGLTHDYRAKGGVEFSRIYTPEGAPDWAKNRESLWNAAEAKENRKNSQTAREFEVAFPYEFNAMQRREAGDAIARELMRRYGAAVDIAYHVPHRDGDQRNYHAHILFTGRGFDADRPDGWDKTKYRDLNKDQITVDGQKTTRSQQEVNSLREYTAGVMNRIAEREKLDVKTEHLSFEERGLDKEPTKKLGPVAAEMEKRGEQSERGDINRDIKAANDNRKKLEALREEAKVIELEIEREKRRILEEKARKAKAQAKAKHEAQRERVKVLEWGKEQRERLEKEQRIERQRLEGRLKWERQDKEASIRKRWHFHIEQNRQSEAALQAKLDRGGVRGVLFRLRHGKQAREDIENAKRSRLNAEKRQEEEIGALDKRDRYHHAKMSQRHKNERQALEQDIGTALARGEIPTRDQPMHEKARVFEKVARKTQDQKAEDTRKQQSRPLPELGKMRSQEEIQEAVKKQGWQEEQKDIFSGLKPEFQERAREAYRQAKEAEIKRNEKQQESIGQKRGPRLER